MNTEMAIAPWHGKIELAYEKRADKTEMRRCFTQSPFKIQRPFYPEGQGICHTILLHTAGGIVGGDRLTQTLQLQPHSHVFLTTAAANKIYRSNGQRAEQTAEVNLATHSVLEYFPQESIVFDGADYQQSLQVNLGKGAIWLSWEIIRFGRTARDEKFISGNWRGTTEIWQEGKPIWCDRQWLPGSPELFAAFNGLNNQAIVGTLAFVGQGIDNAQLATLRETQAQLSYGLGGMTQLPLGLLCRYRGSSTTEVKRWFIDIWRRLRPLYAQPAVTLPRVWQSY